MPFFSFEGQYKSYLSTTSPVTIYLYDEETYLWTNEHSISFKLFITDDPLILKVDEKSLYFSEGFKQCQFQANYSNDDIIRLIGPWGEPYEKQILYEEIYDSFTYDGVFRNVLYINALSKCYDVTITRINNGVLYWKNHAGLIWSMIPTKDPLLYDVGKECPFYNKGFKICRLEFENYKLTRILGPNNASYQVKSDEKEKKLQIIKETNAHMRTESDEPKINRIYIDRQKNKMFSSECWTNEPKKTSLSLYEGYYERKANSNEHYLEEESEEWNFATIKKEEDGYLYWNNRAGRTWRLNMMEKEGVFEIGDDCPFFNKGFKSCRFEFCKQEKKVKSVCMYENKVFKKIEEGKHGCLIF